LIPAAGEGTEGPGLDAMGAIREALGVRDVLLIVVVGLVAETCLRKAGAIFQRRLAVRTITNYMFIKSIAFPERQSAEHLEHMRDAMALADSTRAPIGFSLYRGGEFAAGVHALPG
jgi:hypothetical protein